MHYANLPTESRQDSWLIRDCLGFSFAAFTHMLMIYGIGCTFYFHMFPLDGNIHSLVFFLVLFVAYIFGALSHRKAMTTNPGALPMNTFNLDDYSPSNIPKFCSKCSCVKIPHSHHCSVCQRCIKKMDHHCPWINNCVGENNLKFFLLFCLYIFIMSATTLIYLGVKFFVLTPFEKEDLISIDPKSTICTIVLAVEAFVFAFFTILMIISQLINVFQNTTSIGKLKNEYFKDSKKTKYQKLTDLFGEPISYRWLLPVDPPTLTKHNEHLSSLTV